ncbi:MAG: tyrosine--tRNA ligase [Actinomycetota bacterium]|nr:tyrosine--tRNA ligase [Actinomycetota bacterium]
MEKEIKRQLDILSSGALEVLPGDGLKAKIAVSLKENRPLIVKLGVDPTAPDLHLGHAVPLRKLRQFQDLGHKAVLIIGDFTALVGDPSGRSATRPPLTPEQVKINAKTYTDQAFKVLDDNPQRLEIRYNSKWLGSFSFETILKLTARFTVAGLLVRDDFMKRYKAEQPIGLHEFLYPVMQAYDSVEIRADIELGGSDQKFNLLAGRQLQEKFEQEPQVALTLPLLEGTDGVRKMSKSYDNHIGLTFEPADMFGKVMRVPDEGPEQPRFSLILKYYQLALGYLPDKVAAIAADLEAEKLDPRDAKEELAWQVVATYQGREAADAARADFDARFRRPRLQTVHADTERIVTRMPAVEISVESNIEREALKEDGTIWVPKLLVLTGGAQSTSEGRRLIEQSGVRFKGELITDPATEVKIEGGEILQIGKRKVYKLTLLPINS